MSYNTASYGMMMRDKTRLDAFTSALRRAIEPGVTTVLDIGTGTGIMAFVAAAAGARRVFAVEPNPAIEVAREIVRLNGLEDRVELHKAMSTDLDLPPCDVVISDLRGRLPLFEAHIPTIVDARTRLLKPGGQLIALRDVIYAAPIEHAETWFDSVGHWDDNAAGIDMTPAKRVTANTVFDLDRDADDLLAAPTKIAEIDYTSVESPHLSANGCTTIERDGMFHGLAVWFDIVLDAHTRLCNGIGDPRLVYGRPFMPVFEPFAVHRGEQLEFEFHARHVRSDYVWSWRGEVVGDPSRSFSQSTFDGADVAPEDLENFRLDATPHRSKRAQLVAFVLERMDGENSIATIATALRDAFPSAGDQGQSIDFVSAVIAEHGSTA